MAPVDPLLFEHATGGWTEVIERRTGDGCRFVYRADVTEREHLMRSLRENEKRFRAIAGETVTMSVSRVRESTHQPTFVREP